MRSEIVRHAQPLCLRHGRRPRPRQAWFARAPGRRQRVRKPEPRCELGEYRRLRSAFIIGSHYTKGGLNYTAGCRRLYKRAHEADTVVTGTGIQSHQRGSNSLLAMAPTGPCVHCGSTISSIWYGGSGQGAVNYCKRRACMRAGGYAPALRPKRQRAGPPVPSTDSDDDDPSDDATKIGELFGIHGFR